ncbi:toxin-antitoxin system YwqK family antitoxin [Tenacibaculum geojense]|uniref:Toxin-antitoxin system YwqK family antitoxin n=1 Tax=Tenacibaculum geojense TaxID=915352 RepID=A0ABW3JSE8_9FLAO
MKTSTLLLAMFVSFFATSITAQSTIWFDANWQITSKDKGMYYRPEPKKVDNGYWIVDYYKNGQIQMEGLSSNKTPLEEEFEGLVSYYHSNGKPYHKANYKEGELHGLRRVYYDTGELKEEGTYNYGKRDGVWKTYYKNGKINSKGKYRNGEKVGVWKTFYKNVY